MATREERAHDAPVLTGLMSTEGMAYVDLHRVIFISGTFTKKGHPESRRVGLDGGVVVYVHNTPENSDRLKHLLPADTVLAVAPKPVKRPRKAAATVKE